MKNKVKQFPVIEDFLIQPWKCKMEAEDIWRMEDGGEVEVTKEDSGRFEITGQKEGRVAKERQSCGAPKECSCYVHPITAGSSTTTC